MMYKLDQTDIAILNVLGSGPAHSDTVSATINIRQSDVPDRLSALQKAGLITWNDEQGYSVTADGLRVTRASGTGIDDDRIDTSPAIEEAIEACSIPPDHEAAVRSVYVFLKYWGDATVTEIQDAIFCEHPAGYDSPDTWWDCIRDCLAGLPEITSPDTGDVWRFNGVAEAENGKDGRHIAGPAAVGDIRHALAHLDCSPSEQAAVRAVVRTIYDQGECSMSELTEAIYEAHPADYETADAWWRNCIQPALSALPHIHSDSHGESRRYNRLYH